MKSRVTLSTKLINTNRKVETDNSKDTTYYKKKIIKYIVNKDPNQFLQSSTKQINIIRITSFH
jgi:CO dehydrogenase/acetyl-CoA synthase alpha subunit